MNYKALALVSAAAVALDVFGVITIELDKEPVKDQRNSRAGTGVGYAGNMSDDGANSGYGNEMFKSLFIDHVDETWKVLEAGGQYVCREWSANDRWQARRAPFMVKTPEDKAKVKKWTGLDDSFDANKIAFDFRKQHGIRTLLTLENYHVVVDYATGRTSTQIDDVKRVILEFVQWIVDNDYKDQVIGFELGNEPYFGSDPENFAERWGEIVPEIKKIFPEVDIGFCVAEYRDGDPDIAAVRKRSTAVDKWFEGGSYFGFQKVNQWSGRFIVASSNFLPQCNHIIYHFYGGDVADGMGPCGFDRIRKFAKAFPEVADKRVWITEYRERSDEDCRCEQMHSSTITKAHYVLATTAAPMFDCTSIHQVSALSGGFCTADGHGSWIVQWDAAGQNFTDPDYTGRPRIEVGPAGPLYRIYNLALRDHPVIMAHGHWDGIKDPEKSWAGVCYYGWSHKVEAWHLAGEKGERPKANGNAHWVCSKSGDGKSLSIIFCNSTEKPWDTNFEFPGYKFTGKAKYTFFRCDPEKQQLHQIPGEPRPTWEETHEADFGSIKVPGTTIGSIIIPIAKQ